LQHSSCSTSSPDAPLAVAARAPLTSAGAGCLGAAEETASATWRDYVALTKPRIMSLLLLTGGCGVVVGAARVPSASLFATTMLGLALACGGASALNHVIDRDIDRLMGPRTRARPVAAHRMKPVDALAFGIGLSTLSFVLLAAAVNTLTAVLALAGNLFYVVVYTRLLKRRTSLNIVIGGAAGAMPPLVGYAAATGHVARPALWLFLIVFLWTPPHFWALALLLRERYADARVPMLPVVRGTAATTQQIVAYSFILIAATFAPIMAGDARLPYAIAAACVDLPFLWFAVRLSRRPLPRRAAQLFHYSLLYLALLFVAFAVDAAL
jgi:protoheme IX farnesyltransferase